MNNDSQTKGQVVDFPNTDERARRVCALVEMRARQPHIEWLLYLSDDAQKYDLEEAALKRMIEAVIKENEKKEREEQAIQRKREQERERGKKQAEREKREKTEEERREEQRKRRERRAREKRERAL